ncbi:signal peptidase I [Desulfovibrio psychrotolerans]|uniref:Signal peptidase I n=1 Tax=Desulfovibrio psychrotolerans TaxID=415242 RepID=A0A7J0BUM3_9BACT|nr:signal peptidase I [Desulfovibrio psychrotolerans]
MSDINPKSGIAEYFEALFVAILLALFIRSFIVQAFTIPSGSMLQTLQIGDYLLVNKFTYGIRLPLAVKETNPSGNSWWSRHSFVLGSEIVKMNDPQRGEIVVFEYPKDPSIHYIKRVVGLPGDTVEVRDKKLYVNGELQDEPYVQYVRSFPGPGDDFGPEVVPDGKYFCLGDNRDESYDSRFWGFVDRSAIVGKAFILYWSMDGISSIRWDRIGRSVHDL